MMDDADRECFLKVLGQVAGDFNWVCQAWWLMVENAKNAAKAVEGAAFASFPDPIAHYGVFKAPNVLKPMIRSFVDNTFTTSLPGIGGATGGGAKAAVEKPARPAFFSLGLFSILALFSRSTATGGRFQPAASKSSIAIGDACGLEYLENLIGSPEATVREIEPGLSAAQGKENHER